MTICIMVLICSVAALQWFACLYQVLIAIYEKVILFCRKKIVHHVTLLISEVHCCQAEIEVQ